MNYLPLFALTIPFLGAFFIYLFGQESRKFRNFLAIFVSALTFLIILLMYWLVVIEAKPIKSFLPFVFPISFFVDPLGILFAVITAFIWLLVIIYSVGYMESGHKPARYYAFLFLLLSANLGVVLSGDLVSLFLFFEGLSLLAYFIVIHDETEKALQAGIKYICMMILGGTFLLAGIFLFYGYSGSIDLRPGLSSLADLGNIKYVIAGLMIFGFGVKAGMIPVHVWLPDAHSAAPSPASALLSGVIIKAGAYGVLRVIGTLFRPSFKTGIWGSHLAEITASIGYVVVWVGIVTMLIGVIMALLQENSKRMLAYHSVSQMGYILMGIGLGGYLVKDGALGFAGGIYHLVNHALFKAALFLGVGAVYYQTKELNMYKLGGLWRKMPFVFLFTLIAALGISGVPLFNGFISKTLLHEAILESAQKVHLPSLRLAEIVFLITGAGTFCSFMKLIVYTFLGKISPEHEKIEGIPISMNISLGILAVFIILFGVFPQFFLSFFLNPVFKYWGISMKEAGYSFFFNLESMKGAFISIFLGGLMFVIGAKYRLFHLRFPYWLGVDYWYGKIAKGFFRITLEDIVVFKRFGRRAFTYLLGGDRFVWQEEIERKILSPLFDKLEEERLGIVRTIINKESVKLRKEELIPPEWTRRMNRIRNIANHLAATITEKRLVIIKAEILKLRTGVARNTMSAKETEENLSKLEVISQGISGIEMKLKNEEISSLMIENRVVPEVRMKSAGGVITVEREKTEKVLIEGVKIKILLGEIKERMGEIVVQDRVDFFEAVIQKVISKDQILLKEYKEIQQAMSIKVEKWVYSIVLYVVKDLLGGEISFLPKNLSHPEEPFNIRLTIKGLIIEHDRDVAMGVFSFMVIFIIIISLLLLPRLF